MRYSIKIPDMYKWRKGFEDAPNVYRRYFVKAMDETLSAAQWIAKKEVPVNTGQLRTSIVTKMRKSKNNLVGEVEPKKMYAKYVEYGTRPHWVPIDAIKRWATARGINPYALQRSIKRKGTKPNSFMYRTAKDVEKTYLKWVFGHYLMKATYEIANKLK